MFSDLAARLMQETWDVSALIDKGTRIHEARGMTMQHLGMELRHIANRAFIDFVTPAQRAWFRRCIAGSMSRVPSRSCTSSSSPRPT